MAKLTQEEIIAAVKEMTVVELNDLVKAIETEFGVLAVRRPRWRCRHRRVIKVCNGDSCDRHDAPRRGAVNADP